MKHLKTYNESNIDKKWSIMDIGGGCEDILLELSDEGFEYEINANNWKYTSLSYQEISEIYNDELRWISIKVEKDPTHISEFLHLLKPVRDRIKSFLEEEGLVCAEDSNIFKLKGTDEGLGYYITYHIPQKNIPSHTTWE